MGYSIRSPYGKRGRNTYRLMKENYLDGREISPLYAGAATTAGTASLSAGMR